MVSERRAARAGLNRVSGDREEPPEWLWQFRFCEWGLPTPSEDEEVAIAAIVKARRQWREACDAWLKARGLVVHGMRALSWHEFRRIQLEEPHRILRRPRNEGASRG